VVTVGSVRAGTAPNVIPDVAEARGIIRVLVPRDRKPVQDLVTDVARHTARAWGCEAEVVIHPGEPVLENHPDLVRHTDPWLQRLNLGVGDALRSFGAWVSSPADRRNRWWTLGAQLRPPDPISWGGGGGGSSPSMGPPDPAAPALRSWSGA
jgi:hypothetical protein